MKMRSCITIAVTLLLLGAIAFQHDFVEAGTRVAYAQQSTIPDPNATVRSVSVSGSGQVNVQPDEAVVQVGVQTADAEAAAALSANSEQMQSLINALEENGVDPEDIQTQTIQLQPQYAGTTGDAPPQPLQMGETPEITGYIATNTVEVRARDLANLGSLLDTVIAAGGNQIEGIRFEVSNATDALESARETAWNDAQQKAAQLAQLADAELGAVLSISEFSRGPIPLAQPSAAVREASAVPIQPGTQDVGVELQVTWRLQ